MRCKACDAELSDTDVKRKGLFTGEYMDLCAKCYGTIREDFDDSQVDIVQPTGEVNDE